MTQASDIVTELESVAAFVGDIFPEATVYYQRVPKKPETGDVAVRFENMTVEQETALTYVDIREWQIIVFGEKEVESPADPDLLSKMDKITRATVGAMRQVIPLDADIIGAPETYDGRPLRYMRIAVNGFSYSAPVKTEDDRWACVGILRTEVRRARDLPTYEKIMRSGVRVVRRETDQ